MHVLSVLIKYPLLTGQSKQRDVGGAESVGVYINYINFGALHPVKHVPVVDAIFLAVAKSTY